MGPSPQPKNCGNLRRQDQRHAHHKIPVARFVAAQVHPRQSADTAAQQRRSKQRVFRDAPAVFPGAAFVRRHQSECRQVDSGQIQKQHFHSRIIPHRTRLVQLRLFHIHLSFPVIGIPSQAIFSLPLDGDRLLRRVGDILQRNFLQVAGFQVQRITRLTSGSIPCVSHTVSSILSHYGQPKKESGAI